MGKEKLVENYDCKWSCSISNLCTRIWKIYSRKS